MSDEHAGAELVLTKMKLVFKDAINPKLIAALGDDVREMDGGTLIGIARRIVTRTMPTGEFFEGLGGDFEIRRTTPFKTKDAGGNEQDVYVLKSGVLFMPQAYHSPIADKLKAEKDDPEHADSVEFVGTIKVLRDNNAQGYTWGFISVSAPRQADPLAALRHHHAAGLVAIAEGNKAAALTDQRKGKAHAPAAA